MKKTITKTYCDVCGSIINKDNSVSTFNNVVIKIQTLSTSSSYEDVRSEYNDLCMSCNNTIHTRLFSIISEIKNSVGDKND